MTLETAWTPEPVAGLDVETFVAAGPHAAASAVWHADDADYGALVRRLATNAAHHHDAHLAKYTLACIDASATTRPPGASSWPLPPTSPACGRRRAALPCRDSSAQGGGLPSQLLPPT